MNGHGDVRVAATKTWRKRSCKLCCLARRRHACWRMPLSNVHGQPGPRTGCCAWRKRLPIWRKHRRSAKCTWPKPCNTDLFWPDKFKKEYRRPCRQSRTWPVLTHGGRLQQVQRCVQGHESHRLLRDRPCLLGHQATDGRPQGHRYRRRIHLHNLHRRFPRAPPTSFLEIYTLTLGD